MADSNRETILESLKTTLGNITVAKGFNNDVSRVARKMLTIDDPTITFPVLMLLGGGEVYEDQLSMRTISRFKVKIRGYSRNETDPEGYLNSLIQDVLKVLENASYNAYARAYRPISLDTDEGWLSTEVNGIGMFELTIEILYRYDRSNP